MGRTGEKSLSIAVGALLLVALSACGPEFDVVIEGGRVMDPESGLDAVRNVGIRDGTVAIVTQDHLDGARVIDAAGLVVAPGFIDLHRHGQSVRAYELQVHDGVTTGLELELEPWTAMVAEQGRAHSAAEAMAAAEELQTHVARLRGYWDDHDLFACPTIAHPPFEIGHLGPDVPLDVLAERYSRFEWLTPPWSIAGQPAVSIPLHETEDGLPRGTQIVGRQGRDDLVLAVAATVER